MEQVRLLKPREVAGMLRISVERVRQMCCNGELPSLRVGNLHRIPEAELKKWIRENHHNGKK